MIGFPVGGSCHPAFTKSLLDLQKFELTNPDENYELVKIDFVSGLYIQNNRNELIDDALNFEYDWLLQIDTDEQFKPELLRQLMGFAKKDTTPIVFGLYSSALHADGEAEDAFYCIDMIYRETRNGEYTPIAPPSDVRPFEVDAAGGGIMLIHTSVFKKMEYPWFIATYCVPIGKNRLQPMSEDIAFCRSARENGYHLWVVPLAEAVHYKTLGIKTSLFAHFMERAEAFQKEQHTGLKTALAAATEIKQNEIKK
jgi:GT2 family glycosyltransferase